MRDTFDITTPEPRRLEGRHVLAMLVAFFAAVFAVNGYFLASALSTHTGVVSIEPYRKGLAYNQRIDAGERQNALGWRDTISATLGGDLSVGLVGPDGVAIRGLTVRAVIGRPSTGGQDRHLILTELASGGYSGAVGALQQGNWIAAIEARSPTSGSEPVYRARRRLWLKP